MAKFFANALIAGLFAATLPTSASSQSTCGACGFPATKLASAERLEEMIAGQETDSLRRLHLIGAVCAPEGLECGNLTEEEAGRLVHYNIDTREKRWDIFQKAALGLIAFAGLFLGILNRYRPRH